MSSWDMGYHSDSQYIYQYFSIFNPLWLKFVLTANGLNFPDMKKGYACELGFGQGISINMHALASNVQWYGNDFNPSQVNFARDLASIGHANVHLYDDSFEQFSQRTDLPDFDLIVIHGIWSWVSPENQQYLVDFVNKHLKVGGVLYISYNIAPGFTPFEPMRHLLKLYIDQMMPKMLSPADQVHDLHDFVQKLVDTKPLSLVNYPTLPANINHFFSQDPNYLMAEYFNMAWDITHFSTLAKKLESIKLQFACSAFGHDMIDILNMDPEQVAFITPLAGTQIFEDTRDFMIYQQFRADIFVKGTNALTQLQMEKKFRALTVVRTTPLNRFKYKIKRRFKDEDIELLPEIYEPVMNFFKDHLAHSFGDVIDKLTGKEHLGHVLTDQEVIDALRTLTAIGELIPAVPNSELANDVVKRCQKFNRDFILTQGDSPSHFLACPVTGGAIKISDTEVVLLTAYLMRPSLKKDELKQLLCSGFNIFDPNLDEDHKKAVAEADRIVTEFVNDVLPCYKALKMF